MHVCAYMCACVHICVCLYVHVCMYACMCVSVCMCVYMCMHVCVHVGLRNGCRIKASSRLQPHPFAPPSGAMRTLKVKLFLRIVTTWDTMNKKTDSSGEKNKLKNEYKSAMGRSN
jgi:hypothetical protein